MLVVCPTRMSAVGEQCFDDCKRHPSPRKSLIDHETHKGLSNGFGVYGEEWVYTKHGITSYAYMCPASSMDVLSTSYG